MNVEIRSNSGITLVPLEAHLMSKRKLSIKGEITEELACEFRDKMIILNNEDSQQPIDVMINSSGGEINSGLLIYDTIQNSKAPVRLFCTGKAYSMGAVLFASGTHGRYILPHSEVMIHEPRLGNQVSGNSSSIRSISDSLLEAKNVLVKILSKHTGKSEAEIEESISYDHYFTPEECIEFGLCDEIVNFDKLLEG